MSQCRVKRPIHTTPAAHAATATARGHHDSGGSEGQMKQAMCYLLTPLTFSKVRAPVYPTMTTPKRLT